MVTTNHAGHHVARIEFSDVYRTVQPANPIMMMHGTGTTAIVMRAYLTSSKYTQDARTLGEFI